jgi:WD40 repeat protein
MAVGGKGSGVERDADIFISYQRDTQDKARKLAEALRRDNRDVFIDMKLSSDANWRADIEKKLSRSRCVVAVWSKKAAASGWVNYEAFRAQQEGKLVAVTFDQIRPNELPPWLTDQQITSLRDWKDKDHIEHNGWLNISRAVHAKCGKLPDYRFKGWLGGGIVHERVTSLSFHPTEDARLVSTGGEGSAALWLATMADPNRGKSGTRGADEVRGETRVETPKPGTEYSRNSIWRGQFSPAGDRIVLACRDGVARVYNWLLERPLFELPHTKLCGGTEMAFARRGGGNLRDGVQDACFLPNGNIVTVGGYHAVTWDAEGKPLRSEPTSMPDGARAIIVRALYCDVLEGVVIGDRLGKVRVLDADVGEIGYQIDDREDNANVHLALGRTLVDGMPADGVLAIVSESSMDSDVKFHYWNTLPGKKIGAFAEARTEVVSIDTPPIRGIAIHPTAPVIAIASNAVQPKLFDHQMIEALPLERKKGWHDGAVTAVAFSSSGKYLAAGSEDGRISIWENHARAF